jgi:hypothetical protein
VKMFLLSLVEQRGASLPAQVTGLRVKSGSANSMLGPKDESSSVIQNVYDQKFPTCECDYLLSLVLHKLRNFVFNCDHIQTLGLFNPVLSFNATHKYVFPHGFSEDNKYYLE